MVFYFVRLFVHQVGQLFFSFQEPLYFSLQLVKDECFGIGIDIVCWRLALGVTLVFSRYWSFSYLSYCPLLCSFYALLC